MFSLRNLICYKLAIMQLQIYIWNAMVPTYDKNFNGFELQKLV